MTFRRQNQSRSAYEVQNRLRTSTAVTDVQFEVVEVERNPAVIRAGEPGYRLEDGRGPIVNGGQYAAVVNPPDAWKNDINYWFVNGAELFVVGANASWSTLTFLVF